MFAGLETNVVIEGCVRGCMFAGFRDKSCH